MAGFANDVVFANNGDFSIAGSSKGSATNGLNTNGQMWIGRTAVNAGGTHISVGNLTSPDASITIGYSAPNITLQSSSGLGRFPITPYVVGPSGQAGYQTIQSALNAANAAGGGMVYVQPGTYTENLTFFDNTQIVSVEYEDTGDIILIGTHTPPATGAIAIRGFRLQSATHIFSSAVAGSTNISILECTFAITAGFIFNLANWTGTFNINDCGELSTNNGVLNNTGGSALFVNNSQVGAGTTQTMVCSGSCRLDLTFLDCPAGISAGTLFVNLAAFGKTLTLSGTVTGSIVYANFFPASGAALSMGSSNAISLLHSTINSSNNPAVTGAGAGTLTYENIVFLNNALFAGTLTLATAAWRPYSQAIAAADATKVGTCNFDSASFAVSSAGFVTLAGGGEAIDSIAVQTGTSPIVPTAAGLVTINGATVAAGTNPVRTHGTGANTMALEVQISQALAATDATKIGLSNFDSAAFDVDANGFVQLNGGGIAATAFDVQANTAPGTDPVVPTAAGVVTINGAAVANHSVVLETRSRAANAYNLEVQYGTSAAATDATKSGVAHFNSAQFSVDANGFVSTTVAFSQVVNQVFSATGTYTPTSGMKYCIIEVVGAGGGGGGIVATNVGTVAAAGGGGGAGGYSKKVFTAADIGASKAVTIGAGGTAGSTAGGNGGTGGTTSVGATLLQATGGVGGTGQPTASAFNMAPGGVGGVGSIGTLNANGAPGGEGLGYFLTGVFILVKGGVGGSSLYGGGGISGVTAAGLSAAGNNGTAFGSGGSGAYGDGAATARAGGVGSDGVVYVTEFV